MITKIQIFFLFTKFIAKFAFIDLYKNRQEIFHMKIVTLALSIALILFSCSKSGDKEDIAKAEALKQKTEDSLALKVAVMPTLDCLPIFIAKDRKIFDKFNVKVSLRRFNAQMDCDTALTGGSVQGGVTDVVRYERLMQKGTRLRIIAATNLYWQLIANKSARIKEVSQLSDKMIAMTRYSATDYLTDKVLSKAKLKYPAFKIQINDVLIRLKMLQNNEVDAMWLAEPQASTARIYGNVVLMDSRNMNQQLGVIVFRMHDITTKEKSDQLYLFIKGYNAACDSINKFGITHYADILEKYCNADIRSINNIPKMHFNHARTVLTSNLEEIKNWYKKL